MINAMRDAGLDPGSIISDGKLRRFDVPGDRPKSLNGWYVAYDGDIQAGRFGSWKTGENISWCSKSKSEFTAEEKTAYKAKMEAARRQRESELALIHEECRAASKILWEASRPADSNHPYLVRKQVISHGLRQSGDSLMVPVRSIDGTLHGIQFIKPEKADNGKDKIFKTGTAKQGHFHIIGKPIDNTMIVCEGYATGASIHHATGHSVLVAFDAGNLKAVAGVVRTKYPSWTIIIAADNDQFTKDNPGVTKSRDAAQSVDGLCRIPSFNNLDSKPTDFNDLHNLEGADTVRRAIFPPPMAEYEPPSYEDDYDLPLLDSPVSTEEFTEHPLTRAPFQLLGYDYSEYFYLSNGSGQVKSLTADKHTLSHLLTLAPLTWWEMEFPAKQSFDELAAKNMLIQTNHNIGIYDSSRIRGLGAWEDKGRSVLHLGDTLVVDGERVPLNNFKSRYIYERAISISDEDTKPLPASEANKLIQLCDMLSWEKSINGRLLAGWCVASIICGALKWRPHMWLTGPSGSGKSWIIHSIIKYVSGPHLKGMLGSTTEAGLRNALKNDAFSVFFDEFEAEDRNAAARIQAILEFARPASSNEDSKIYKAKSGGGGVNSYQPRSCIGVASINVNMTQKADLSRVTVLSLVNGSKENFENTILPFWTSQFTPEFARGIRSRSILQIPTINKNADIFQRAVTTMMGSRRSGDQYGSLLACAYSLCSSNVVTIDQAREFVGRQDWDGHVITDEQGDERTCLNSILESLIMVAPGTHLNIAELLIESDTIIGDCFEKKLLLRHGIKFVLGGFVIANKHTGIAKMLEKTPWAGNWSRILARLPGALKTDNHKFHGGQSRGIMLPISYVKGA